MESCEKCGKAIEDTEKIRKRPNGKVFHEHCGTLEVLSRPTVGVAAAAATPTEQKLKLLQNSVTYDE